MSTDLTASQHIGTELHRYAEALLASLAADTAPSMTPPDLSDVTDYWLAPAVEALELIMRGEDALGPLGRAAQLDEQRTALFLCLALAVSGQGEAIHASWLGIAFGELSADRPVTHGQRALWLAAARGAYGPAGKIFVLRKLDSVPMQAEAAPERWLSALIPHEPAIVIPPSLVDFPELAELPELAEPVQAADQLSRLLGRCVEITSVREGTGGKPVNRAGRPATVWIEGEPLTVLRRLIGSGGPEGPMNALTGHLLTDLQPGSDPHLAAIALHMAAPTVRAAAENLARATEVDPPESVTMPLLGHRVVLRPEGPEPESLAAAQKHITTEGVPVRGRPWLAYALFVLGAVTLVAALVTPMTLPLAALALALAAAGGHRLWQRRRDERADVEYVTAQLAELRELADGAVWALHEYARESEKRAQTAASDLAELIRLLRRGPRAR
ncbi:hypothetical protein FHR32_002356 [Streptosporangium album]|uniref:Uncharacterized protein n=1 Tax=Streptosporangium album TaxID=47479 RepID=A0A7W7RVA9_9ACTN|nr:hypothetical protein [Streptosporangium album]MBB4938051.1 hypothetical protein [Streptosporangium album]